MLQYKRVPNIVNVKIRYLKTYMLAITPYMMVIYL